MAGSGGSDGPSHAPLSLVLTAATPLAHVLRSRTLRVSVDEVPNPNPNPNPNLNHVQPAQLGVGIKGGLVELVHAVTAALQCHPVLPNPWPR